MSVAARISRALRSQRGFSLLELLIVIVIMGILVVAGVTSYLGMRTRGEDATAKSNVRAALNSVEAFYSDASTYSGMTRAALQGIDQNIMVSENPVISGDGGRYCIESTHNGRSTTAGVDPGKSPFRIIGPGGNIEPGTCPAAL